MSLFEVLGKNPDKRYCVECGREAPGIIDACGICAREARDAGEKEPKVVPLCSIHERDCSSKHVRKHHSAGLIGEKDPNWPGKR